QARGLGNGSAAGGRVVEAAGQGGGLGLVPERVDTVDQERRRAGEAPLAGVNVVGDDGGANRLAGDAEIGQGLAEQIGGRGRVSAVGYDQKLDVHAAIVTPCAW